MDNRRYMLIGTAVIVIGLLALVSALTGVEFCSLVLPLLLIAAGAYLILRPRLAPAGSALRVRLLGDIRRTGAWTPLDEEVWILIGDATFDLTQAILAPGETVIRFFGFVGTLRLIVPETVPVAASSTAFLTSARVFGQKTDTFLAPFDTVTEGYESAESKVRFESWHFVSDLKLRRPAE